MSSPQTKSTGIFKVPNCAHVTLSITSRPTPTTVHALSRREFWPGWSGSKPLAASPWAFAYNAETMPTWNAIVAGGLITLIALCGLYRVFAWQKWANLGLGLWLVVSPWALGFTAMQMVALNAVIVGVLVAVLAYWVIASDRDIGGWFSAEH